MVFILLSVFCMVRFLETGKGLWNLLAGISLGLALLSKHLPALILIPIWFLLIIDSGKLCRREIFVKFSLFILPGISLFTIWLAYISIRFPEEAGWETYYNFLHVTDAVEGQSGSFLYHFDKMRMNYGELIYLPVLWFIYFLFRPGDRFKKLVIFTWLFLPYLFFSFAKTQMQGYTLFAAPALFIITAVFFTHLTEYRALKRKLCWPVIVIQILLVALPVRYTIERVKPFEKLDRNPAWAVELRDLERTLPYGRENVLFNVDRPIEAMFYVNRTAYSNTPDKQVVEEILTKGYRVYINHPDEVPEEINGLPGIQTLNLEYN